MLHFSPTNDPHTPKSPSSKIKHTRDDSSLDKSQTKLNTAQSCRRITTEQSPNIKKFHDTVVKKPTDNKSSKNKNKNSQPKISKQSSSKNLKNIKLSNSVNKKIESYLNVFSPKTKNLQPPNLPKQPQNKDLVTTITQKSGLKKTTGAKANIIRVNKTTQDDKISAFIPYSDKDQQKRQRSPNNDNKKSMKKTNKSKLQKPLFKLSTQSKPTALKTLQNEPISILSNKHRNSNKADQPSISKKPSTNQRRPNTRQKPLYHNLKMKTQQSMLSYCQSTPSQIFTHDIDFLQLIGEGTFGKVYKGIIKKTSQIVAVKKVFQDKKYKNRQIEIISMVRNSNFVMKVMGTYMTYEDDREYLNIVMRYYQGDLYKDIHGKVGLSNMEIKIYTYQILRGLLYLHSKKICHRDIKPHNILTNNMQVAICDFGSAKILHPLHQNLAYICSRCYRAPQLIFGATHYTTMIDIWSLGCVILEMIHGSPFFIGNSSIDQLIQIIKVLGTPTKSQVKEMNQEYDLKDYKFPNIKCKQLKEVNLSHIHIQLFPTTDPLLLDLLSQLMLYSPKQRLNAAQALVHQYFDQLRDQQTYTTLRKDFNLCDFFDFTPQQMKQNEHLYGQLVPEWYTKGHFTYFENQEIERNNTLKFYVG